ncbi:unnamed protein product [Ambrosiozyma monospora]|uniref:Unnamed protein product n=1 Tax=Ambrosiozyma monospora TaxID=43982 RepID=A0A9W6Z3S9_AMBMO|nr:unnamed protein product [Ambrosiozyma monospora]
MSSKLFFRGPYQPRRALAGLFFTRFQSTIAGSSTSPAIDFYKLFPKTFPNGAPPNSDFKVNSKLLRKEYRALQASNHPDLVDMANSSKATEFSSLLNKAYSTLNDPLTRSQYLLKKNAKIDLNEEGASQRYQLQSQETLLDIMEIHEQLEEVKNEEDVARMEKENKKRVDEAIESLQGLYKKLEVEVEGESSSNQEERQELYELIAAETVKLKYWVNIHNALKQWEAGCPVTLTH